MELVARNIGAIVAGLLLAGCTQQPPMNATPAVWVVRDADTQIYVTGTVHLLPDRVNWHNGAIRVAMDDAQSLITELDQSQIEAAPKIAQRFLYGTASIPLHARFEPELRDAFVRQSASQLMTFPDANRLDDWAAALMLAQAVAAKEGLESGNGMDRGLAADFARAGKPQSGLESAADQFARFDAIPPAEQRYMLNRLMRNIAVGRADDELRETIDAWASGNIDRLSQTIERDRKFAPQTHRLMLAERNAQWALKLKQRMARPGRVLVAVGAGHLAGPDSLIALLERQGLEVRRLP